jgi:hypothetical protein
MPELQVSQQTPLHDEKAGMMFERLARIDKLDIKAANELREDFVHLKEGEMSSYAEMRTTTKLQRGQMLAIRFPLKRLTWRGLPGTCTFPST